MEVSIYIYDPVLGEGIKFGCDEVLKKRTLKNIILKNGFEIIDEFYHEEWGWLLFKCRIKD